MKQALFLLTIFFSFNVFALNSQDIEKFYLLGQYDKSFNMARTLISQSANPGAKTYYLAGLSALKTGKYAEAESYFRKVAKEYSRTSYYQSSLVKIADANFYRGNLDKALQLYSNILKQFPQNKYKPHIFLRLAQIYAKKGVWGKKHYYLSLLREKYPQAEENKIARILSKRGDYFYIQAGAFINKKNALKLLNQLRPDYPVYLEKDAGIYKVKIGNFTSRQKAVSIYKKLAQKGYPARIYP